MNKVNDGGPAFPSAAMPTATDERNEQRDGMTLRDWFAGQALAGVLANSDLTKFLCSLDPSNGHDKIAAHSIAFADAMIDERERSQVK